MTTLYAGDVGIEVRLTMSTSTFDGTDCASARLMVAGPAVAPGDWPTEEWTVTIASQSETEIEILHTTDGTLTGTVGEVRGRAYFYDVDDALIGRSEEFRLQIARRYVGVPE